VLTNLDAFTLNSVPYSTKNEHLSHKLSTGRCASNRLALRNCDQMESSKSYHQTSHKLSTNHTLIQFLSAANARKYQNSHSLSTQSEAQNST